MRNGRQREHAERLAGHAVGGTNGQAHQHATQIAAAGQIVGDPRITQTEPRGTDRDSADSCEPLSLALDHDGLHGMANANGSIGQ